MVARLFGVQFLRNLVRDRSELFGKILGISYTSLVGRDGLRAERFTQVDACINRKMKAPIAVD